MRTIGVDERRARLARRHRLAARARTVEDAVASMAAFHSSDPVTVYLSAWARVERFTVTDLEEALYDRRSLVRMLGMRRTLFVVDRDMAAAMDESCTKALAPAERRRLVAMIEEQGVAPAGRGSRWLTDVMRRTADALDRRGEASARELSKDVPELTRKLAFGEGKRWAGEVGISTRVLFLLATEGEIVRARPLGTWVSGQYRWARTETWLGAALPTAGRDTAAAHVLERYLRAFGPATLTDVRWWTGWTVQLATSTLAAVGAIEVGLDDGVGYVLPDDTRPVRAPSRWVALLPGLDPTTMGWKERAWYLGDHASELFDRAGNAGPTVWADGRIVGGWSQTAGGAVVLELLEDVDVATRAAIDGERTRLDAWLGGLRVTPRFRTPLERRLSG